MPAEVSWIIISAIRSASESRVKTIGCRSKKKKSRQIQQFAFLELLKN
jgi:hypothetical protein